MGLKDLFKKKYTIINEDTIKAVSKERRYRSLDKIDYQYDYAMKHYCTLKNKSPDELIDHDIDEIYRYAGNHIGFFMVWIIKHHFEGDIHKDFPKALEDIRNETLLPVDFVINQCDSKFWGEDVSDEIFNFVDDYYENQYLTDYSNWVINDLHDLPLEFIGTWEDYHKFEPLLDQAYEAYKKKKRR